MPTPKKYFTEEEKKAANRLKSNRWYARNKAKVAAAHKQFALLHPIKARAAHRRYCKSHRELRREAALAYYYKHAPEYNMRSRAWAKKHPKRMKAINRVSRQNRRKHKLFLDSLKVIAALA